MRSVHATKAIVALTGALLGGACSAPATTSASSSEALFSCSDPGQALECPPPDQPDRQFVCHASGEGWVEISVKLGSRAHVIGQSHGRTGTADLAPGASANDSGTSLGLDCSCAPRACADTCSGAPDGVGCDDSNPCTGDGVCASGVCQHGAALCVAGPVDACTRTTGACDPDSGECLTEPVECGGPRTLFAEDFEDLENVQMSVDAGLAWLLDDPSAYAVRGLPPSAYEGSYCAGTNFDDVYHDNVRGLLFTPELDLSGVASATLTYHHFYDLEWDPLWGPMDGYWIVATPDQGLSWYELTPDGGYPAAEITASGPPFLPGFSGSIEEWQLVTVDLGPLAAFAPRWILAFEFASDDWIAAGGAFIDDIRVTAR